MALGIAASTAIFTVVDAVLLRPLPVPHPEDFAYVGWVWEKGDDTPSLTSWQYEFVCRHARLFDAVATYRALDARVSEMADTSTPVRGLGVGGAFFQAVGFAPRTRRAFDAAEIDTGDASVVILGDGVWRTRFGADPDILGRRVLVDGEPRTVVGIMPPDFFFPPAVDHDGFLVPVEIRADERDEGHNTEVIARLRHGTSGVLAASFARLMRVDLGFDPGGVIAVKPGSLPDGYDAARRAQLADRLLEHARRLPGVEHAAIAPNLPLERGMNFPVDTREHPERAIGAVELRFVSPDYFATLGVPLAGRDFAASDVTDGEPVAIVNEAFASHFWGDEPRTGRTIQIGHFRDRWLSPQLERQTHVVGAVGDMHEIGVDRAPRPTVAIPWSQRFDDRAPVLLVRGTGPQLGNALRQAVLAEDRQLVPSVEPLTAAVHRSVAVPRFRAVTLRLE